MFCRHSRSRSFSKGACNEGQCRTAPIGSGRSIADLTGLLHRAYARLGALGFNYTACDQSERVTRERIATGACLVLTVDGRLSGTLLFKNSRQASGADYYARPDVASIAQFAVEPGLQGQGLGPLMLRAAEICALASDADILALDTAEGATGLIAWYGRQGYEPVSHVQWSHATYRSTILARRLRVGA